MGAAVAVAAVALVAFGLFLVFGGGSPTSPGQAAGGATPPPASAAEPASAAAPASAATPASAAPSTIAASPPTVAPPVLPPIHAEFDQQTFTTTYAEAVPTLDGLSFVWSVSIPADPECASGFKGNTPAPNQAAWFHADASEKGPCNHAGSNYGAQGHPGAVTVVVTSASWRFQANYFGTITGDGTPPQCVRS